MANHSLAHPDEHSQQIDFKDLEIIHNKITQVTSQLYILSDWITESSLSGLSLENNGRVDGVLCAVLSLLEEILKSLPEF